MTHESESLNSQIFGFDAYAGDFVPRPVAPEDLPRLLKIRQMYVDAGLMPELKENPQTTNPSGPSKPLAE